MTRKKDDTTVTVDKHIEEARLDSNRRAKDTIDYEQMLFAFIENELKGEI